MSQKEELTKLCKYLNALGLKAEVCKHGLEKALDKIKEAGLDMSMFSGIIPTCQIITEGEWGKISIIKSGISMGKFEIYSIKGDLFEGIRRYKTMTDCGRTVYGLLTTGTFDGKIPRVFDVWTDWLDSSSQGGDGPVQDVLMDPDELSIFRGPEPDSE